MSKKPTETLTTLPLVALMSFASVSCAPAAHEIELSGHTQGTTYSIHAFCTSMPGDLSADVERLLQQVDRQMSTYDPNSTLSKFNASASEQWQSVPATLVRVVAAAQQLARMSGGAFDVTVGPLVNAWGFGPGGVRGTIPSQDGIAAARANIGYAFLAVRLDPPALRKTRAVYVDLSAIAQGYTVDALGELLDGRGCPSYLIDVGG